MNNNKISSGEGNNNLIDAYLKTTYFVSNKNIEIKIGVHNSVLDSFLNHNNYSAYAFISAQNPMSEKLDDSINDIRHNELIEMVKKFNLNYFEGYGQGIDGWKDEKSLLIANITREKAIEFGIYFKQKAIVFGEIFKAPELMILDSYYH